LVRKYGEYGCRSPGPEPRGPVSNRDSIEDLLEEPGHHESGGLVGGESAGLGVEDLLLVHSAAGGAVRAADVVGLDLEPRDRVGPCLTFESIRLSFR
jgi:hypothetical protein